MNQELGRLEDLPADYVTSLAKQNLVPLWPSLRAVMPAGKPRPRTQATCWSYRELRPLLMRSGELAPIEKAERRVLVLANPGHGIEKMQASAAIYLGVQLLLPGEWAPSHRHTPNAVRMVIEGEGAWTTVEGERCIMQRGDLILTPTGLWHEHGHDGDQPVVWLDVLDLPLVHYMEASYHESGDGQRQAVRTDHGERRYSTAGILPTPVFQDHAKSHAARYPMLRYPWARTRSALEALASEQADQALLQITYVNPRTGEDSENILGFHALMLRPGQTLKLPARSPAQVFHLIEGGVSARIDDQHFQLAEADTCCSPGYTPVILSNTSAREPAFIFMADESPLHRKLGVYEVR